MKVVQKYGDVKEQAMVFLLLHTGLRVSEACLLRREDVVIKERSGFVRVYQGKGDKYREVPLNVTVRKYIEGYLGENKEGWLFPGRKGPVTSRTIERVLSKFGRMAGIDVTPHMLRHTFGKMLIDARESLDRVAALMGHANLNTTARYTRPSTQDLEQAVNKLAWE